MNHVLFFEFILDSELPHTGWARQKFSIQKFFHTVGHTVCHIRNFFENFVFSDFQGIEFETSQYKLKNTN